MIIVIFIDNSIFTTTTKSVSVTEQNTHTLLLFTM